MELVFISGTLFDSQLPTAEIFGQSVFLQKFVSTQIENSISVNAEFANGLCNDALCKMTLLRCTLSVITRQCVSVDSTLLYRPTAVGY